MQTPAHLKAFLHSQGLGALVITRHANFAWLTGGRAFIGTGAESGAAQVLVTPERMLVVTSNIEAGRLQAEELPEGWGVHSYNWWEDGQPARLIQSLAGGGALGADGPFPGARDVEGALAPLRWTLTTEQQRLARTLGQETGQALEAVARSFAPGETEHQVAARIGAALIARGIDPVVRLVAADQRTRQWRHPLPTGARVERYAMLVVCGQRQGLVMSATRLVHFGPVPDDLLQRSLACARVDAAFIRATRPGATAASVFAAAQAAYAAAGYPDEWQHHHQGGLIAYAAREYRATPTNQQPIARGQLFAWNPTIAGVKSEDSVLLGEEGPEVLTATGDWPQHHVDGLERPAILTR